MQRLDYSTHKKKMISEESGLQHVYIYLYMYILKKNFVTIKTAMLS